MEIGPFDVTQGREPVGNPELVEVVERLFGIFELASFLDLSNQIAENDIVKR